MRRSRWLSLAMVLVLLAGTGALVGAGPGAGPPLGRYIVHTVGPAVSEAARQGVHEHGGLTLKRLATGGGLVVVIPEHAVGPLVGIPGVLAVEPDVVLTAVEVLPWGVNRIDADLVWAANTGSGVGIAIIDTGIDKNHGDLLDNIADGRNFVGKGPSWRRKVDPDAWDDDNGHGTHVAGTAAAVDNDIGVIGVAPAARLWAVKVLDRTGSGYLSDIMDGIYWAADNEMIAVINLSLGIDKETLDQYPSDLAAFEVAVNHAYLTKGVVVVAAAGNEYPGEDTVIYPARFDSVIAVSATDSNDNLASFSSTGPTVELAAPGVGINSTVPDGGYGQKDGTSMASPHVAGTAALVIASGVTGAEEVRLRLQQTVEDLGPVGKDNGYGFGLVDADEAAGPSTPPPTGTIDGTVTNADGGEAISGASVSVDTGQSTTTADDGTYTIIDVRTGDRSVTASADGFESQTSPAAVVEDETTTVNFALNPIPVIPVGSIVGTVTDADDGGLIAGATVLVEDTGQSAQTDDNGTYTITDVPAGGQTVTASATSYTDESKTADVLENQTTTVEFTLVAIAGDTMHVASLDMALKMAGINTSALATVTIVDADGKPVEGATVYGQWSELTNDSDSGVTDASGEVALRSDRVRNASGTFIFTVTDVTKDGWTYHASANVETSDSITVP